MIECCIFQHFRILQKSAYQLMTHALFFQLMIIWSFYNTLFLDGEYSSTSGLMANHVLSWKTETNYCGDYIDLSLFLIVSVLIMKNTWLKVAMVARVKIEPLLYLFMYHDCALAVAVKNFPLSCFLYIFSIFLWDRHVCVLLYFIG